MPEIYTTMSVIILAIVAISAIYISYAGYNTKSKGTKRLSKLTAFAFLLIILGIIFGDNRLLGYSFMGTGVILAVIDAIKKIKNKK